VVCQGDVAAWGGGADGACGGDVVTAGVDGVHGYFHVAKFYSV
jgi:hypothetical protein